MNFSKSALIAIMPVSLALAGLSFAACSGKSSAPSEAAGDGSASNSDGSSTNVDASSSVSTTAGACANPTVAIVFSPMYSAYIPGSTTHTFQIPAVTEDGSAATWSVSDPTQAQLAAETFDTLPGVMITVQGLGANGGLTIFATESDGSCGAATLTITSSTEDDWQIGNQRYNDGVALHLGPPAGFDGGPPMRADGGGMGGFRTSDGGSFFEEDGGTACTNCHGPTATNGPYKDVSHTPEQTGGFSDDQLIQIITQGNIPDGGYFDPTVINANCDGSAECTARAYNEWHAFHQWSDITSDQYNGIIVYLRSLQPESQNGSSNFGGGGHRRDGGGGFGPPPTADAAAAIDAGAAVDGG